MTNAAEVRMSNWAYAVCFAGDAVLLALAWFIQSGQGSGPIGAVTAGLMVFCGLAGGVLAVTPFYLDYQAAVKMAETGAVVSVVSQLDQLQEASAAIQGATSQWQGIQESSVKTAGLAREIAEKMANETASFMKFMREASDAEKGTLRLEIDKLRREQNEFIQIIVRMLDHTYALNQAAARSGQPGLIENLANFQAANRDVARRIGLVPFAPAVNEPFDPKVHQSADSQSMPESNARISETVATGYTYQGALLRPALVALQGAGAPAVVEKPLEKKAEMPPAKPAEQAPAKVAVPSEAQAAPDEKAVAGAALAKQAVRPEAPVSSPPKPAKPVVQSLPREQNLF